MTELRRLNSDVDAAIGRAGQPWRPERTHVENETAYQDRHVLAHEVIALREELAHTQDAQNEAEREVESLHSALLSINADDD